MNWCICNGADARPTAAVTSYAKPEYMEPPFCGNCGHWLLPGQSIHRKNHMGLATSWYTPSKDGH